MNETEQLLNWLGGYFDHGACFKIYLRRKPYYTIGVHVHITFFTAQIATEIRALFGFERATLARRHAAYRFSIRAADEALSFAYQLLPYVRVRKDDLNIGIETINQWVDAHIESNDYHAQARPMVERVLDVRASYAAGKFGSSRRG